MTKYLASDTSAQLIPDTVFNSLTKRLSEHLNAEGLWEFRFRKQPTLYCTKVLQRELNNFWYQTFKLIRHSVTLVSDAMNTLNQKRPKQSKICVRNQFVSNNAINFTFTLQLYDLLSHSSLFNWDKNLEAMSAVKLKFYWEKLVLRNQCTYKLSNDVHRFDQMKNCRRPKKLNTTLPSLF